MKLLDDLTAFQWIRDVRDRFRARRTGISLVTDLVPAGFESYCKILHPIYMDPSIQDPDINWDESMNQGSAEELGRIESILHGSKLVGVSADPDKQYPRIRWKELAGRFQIPYGPAITDKTFLNHFSGSSWPRFLFAPEEGDLNLIQFRTLAQAIRDFSRNEFCYFYYDLLATENFNDWLFEGNLARLEELSDLKVRTTPTYWWPKDRSWCVCTDYDLPFTFVGGPENLIEIICKNNLLESIEFPETAKVADY